MNWLINECRVYTSSAQPPAQWRCLDIDILGTARTVITRLGAWTTDQVTAAFRWQALSFLLKPRQELFQQRVQLRSLLFRQPTDQLRLCFHMGSHCFVDQIKTMLGKRD